MHEQEFDPHVHSHELDSPDNWTHREVGDYDDSDKSSYSSDSSYCEPEAAALNEKKRKAHPEPLKHVDHRRRKVVYPEGAGCALGAKCCAQKPSFIRGYTVNPKNKEDLEECFEIDNQSLDYGPLCRSCYNKLRVFQQFKKNPEIQCGMHDLCHSARPSFAKRCTINENNRVELQQCFAVNGLGLGFLCDNCYSILRAFRIKTRTDRKSKKKKEATEWKQQCKQIFSDIFGDNDDEDNSRESEFKPKPCRVKKEDADSEVDLDEYKKTLSCSMGKLCRAQKPNFSTRHAINSKNKQDLEELYGVKGLKFGPLCHNCYGKLHTYQMTKMNNGSLACGLGSRCHSQRPNFSKRCTINEKNTDDLVSCFGVAREVLKSGPLCDNCYTILRKYRTTGHETKVKSRATKTAKKPKRSISREKRSPPSTSTATSSEDVDENALQTLTKKPIKKERASRTQTASTAVPETTVARRVVKQEVADNSDKPDHVDVSLSKRPGSAEDDDQDVAHMLLSVFNGF